MTAILGTWVGVAPVLLADIVVSTADPEYRGPAYVPSIPKTDIPKSRSQLQICGLVQKMTVIGPHLAIAWTAGDVSLARNLLARISDHDRIEPFTYAALAQLLDTDSPSIARGDVGLIGMVRDATGLRMFGRNVPFHSEERFVGVWAGGSGAKVLAQQLRNLVGDQFTFPNASATQVAVGMAAALSSCLITHEIFHAESLRDGFGGGFELASLVEGGFAKVPDITYVLWLFGSHGALHASRVIRYAYVRDLLVIRTATFEEDAAQVDFYTLVPPVFRELAASDYAIPAPPLLASHVAHAFTYRNRDGGVSTFTRLDFCNTTGFDIEESASGMEHRATLKVPYSFLKETAETLARQIRL
jgi:hypothetical protein